MSALPGFEHAPHAATQPGSGLRPLVLGAADGVLAFDAQGEITRARFVAQVRAVAAQLPDAPFAVNLCEDRYRFLVALCAAAARGQVTLLPPSRAGQAVAQVRRAHPASYCLGDGAMEDGQGWQLPCTLPELPGQAPCVDDAALAVVGFTSGSTGTPLPNPKTWGSFRASTAQNLAALHDLWPAGTTARVVATVPPQHMYGMEMSVLLPLLCDAAVHAGRPLFPQDVARALAHGDGPRLLVSTPVHLRALVEADVSWPPMHGVVSATAPLSAELAAAVEARMGCEVRELFGSTETCIIARRRTARDVAWTPLPGVEVSPRPDGASVRAPHLAAERMLADLVEVQADGRFVLRGRSADLLEIAGKRASLGDLTAKLLAVPGVVDGVVFQADHAHADAAGVRRVAALAVAPGLDAAGILDTLRRSVDPVFLPRPLRCVDALPRNDTGKLPRATLLALLRGDGA